MGHETLDEPTTDAEPSSVRGPIDLGSLKRDPKPPPSLNLEVTTSTRIYRLEGENSQWIPLALISLIPLIPLIPHPRRFNRFNRVNLVNLVNLFNLVNLVNLVSIAGFHRKFVSFSLVAFAGLRPGPG